MAEQQQPEIGGKLIASLNALSKAIEASSGSDQSIAETVGWNGPGVDRHDLSYVAQCIAAKIQQAATHGIQDVYEETLNNFATRIDFLRGNTVQYLWNGNGAQASSAILLTLLMMDQTLAEDLPNWQVSRDLYAIPPKLAKRIRAAEVRLEDIESTGGNLDQKIEKIIAAHEAADAFPADLELLQDAQTKITTTTREIDGAFARAKIAAEDAELLLKKMREAQAEADLIIEKCNDTFRIATSTGLAWAFDERAKELQRTVLVWAGVLLIALIAGVVFGGQRVGALSDLVAKGNDLDWGAIVMQFVLSIASIGAPIWLAWLATKQVGQRFRLAEDYAFKASVAKAYEGYRKEALALDNSDFAARLFGAALERLEEAPLRLVINDPLHASPLQELVASPLFQRALGGSAAFRELVARALAKASPKGKVPSSASSQPSTPADVE